MTDATKETLGLRSFAETYAMRSRFFQLLGKAGEILAEAYTQADLENQVDIAALAFKAMSHSLIEHHGYTAEELATRAEPLPEGEWVMVPREPTREMWAGMGDAVVRLGINLHHDLASETLWEAALAASPSRPLLGGEGLTWLNAASIAERWVDRSSDGHGAFQRLAKDFRERAALAPPPRRTDPPQLDAEGERS